MVRRGAKSPVKEGEGCPSLPHFDLRMTVTVHVIPRARFFGLVKVVQGQTVLSRYS